MPGPITPATPAGVAALLVAPSAARITWTPNPQYDEVARYDVFRNGTKVGESLPASFLDTGLVELTTYSYAVAAVGARGMSSPRSAESSGATIIPPDVTLPRVTGVTPLNRSSGVSPTTTVRVTFSEPIDPTTLTDSTFRIKPTVSVTLFVSGALSYDAATNTAIFTSAAPFRNRLSYEVFITRGIKDRAGNPVASEYTSCFTPAAGAGVATAMDIGHWSGNNACREVHWHIPLAQTGNALYRRADCGADNVDCNITALNEAGRAILGGASCRPASLTPPRLCEVQVAAVTGTVDGTSVSFRVTTDNGLTFNFNGSFAAGTTVNPYITGTISGVTLPAVGINFEREP